jgi:tetratricopeptide (TPR) repeat protein
MSKTKKILIVVIAAVVLIVGAVAVILINKPAEAVPTAASHISLAENYLLDLNYEAAIAEYRAAIQIDPKNADYYIALAGVYIEMGDTEAAIRVLEEGLGKVDEEDSERIIAEIDKLLPNPVETITTTATTTTAPLTAVSETTIAYENDLIEFGFSNFSGKLTYDDNLIGNEGAIAVCILTFDLVVDVPIVGGVSIAAWRDEISLQFILDEKEMYERIWKNEASNYDYNFQSLGETTHVMGAPVWEDDIGKSFDYLLYVFNEDFDIIGYVIVPVTIPSDTFTTPISTITTTTTPATTTEPAVEMSVSSKYISQLLGLTLGELKDEYDDLEISDFEYHAAYFASTPEIPVNYEFLGTVDLEDGSWLKNDSDECYRIYGDASDFILNFSQAMDYEELAKSLNATVEIFEGFTAWHSFGGEYVRLQFENFTLDISLDGSNIVYPESRAAIV